LSSYRAPRFGKFVKGKLADQAMMERSGETQLSLRLFNDESCTSPLQMPYVWERDVQSPINTGFQMQNGHPQQINFLSRKNLSKISHKQKLSCGMRAMCNHTNRDTGLDA